MNALRYSTESNTSAPCARCSATGTGTVVAVGAGTKDNPVTLKVGDTVLYGKYAGTELKLEGKDYLIMRENDVLAVI